MSITFCIIYNYCFRLSINITLNLKGNLSPSKNENKLDKDFYCTFHKFVLIRFIQRNQGHGDAVMHEFHSNVNKVNKVVVKVRTIGDRLPLSWRRLFDMNNYE